MINVPRNPDHDLIKGLAVLLMIQVHVMELFALPEVLEGVSGQLSLFLGGPPVAPVLMLLFGFYALRPPVWPGRLLWRAIKLTLAGAVLNVGLNLHLLIRIFQGQLPLDPRQYLFGVDILLLAGLSLGLITLLRPLFKERAWAWLLASVGVAAISPWMRGWLATDTDWKWLAAFVASDASWSFFPLFPWLAYPLLGVAGFYGREHWGHPISITDQSTQSMKEDCHCGPDPQSMQSGFMDTGSWPGMTERAFHLASWRAPLALSIALLLAVTGPFAVATSHDLSAYYHHDLRFFLWASGFAACWFLVIPRLLLPEGLKAWVRWFGQHLTACYVVQWLLIGNLATALFKTQSLLACGLWVLALVLMTRWVVSVGLKIKTRCAPAEQSYADET
jgi:hypothetical protein